MLDNNIQKLQSNILIDTVFTATTITTFLIYGAIIVVHPRWLRDHVGTLYTVVMVQMILVFILISKGVILPTNSLASRNTSFEKFSIPGL